MPRYRLGGVDTDPGRIYVLIQTLTESAYSSWPEREC